VLEIRKVILADKETILEWRNNPEVYRFALNPTPVSRENHEAWFAKVLGNGDCFFYMGLVDGIKCGTVRYDLLAEKTEAEVSISLAPEFWGKGIGFELMKSAEEYLKRESKVRTIHATVLNENTGSLRLFQKSDFKPYLSKFKKEI
jgi:RimJ/RimL family protein N-acetyltransferase